MPVRLPPGLRNMLNVHRDNLRELLSHNADAPIPSADGLDFLFLCYTNRCGSNLMAELLASTGHFNVAQEFFNFEIVQDSIKQFSLTSFRQYFDHICKVFPKSGRLTAKLAIEHLVVLYESGILGHILDRSRFVVIERNDRLMQAISLSIAAQTGQWTSYHESQTPDDQLVFSKGQIWNIVNNIVEHQACFEKFFGLNGIRQQRFIYEQFSVEPEICERMVAQWLGLDAVRFDMGKIRLRRQRSGVNERWREMFLQDR